MKYDYYEQDWLASRNIFYNTRTNEISDNINELIDPNHIFFSNEGFNNYLQYGYSVFGQTPIEEIKLLCHDQCIKKDKDGRLIVYDKHDKFEELIGKPSSSQDTIEYMRFLLNDRITNSDKKFVVPISGGFDSRIICSLIDDKTKLSGYTYGISKVPSESYEVVYARKLCEILGIDWHEIVLGDFGKLINEWDNIMGVSTHSHGMYQMEFYETIIEKFGCNNSEVISGIFGDVWAGNWTFEPICSSEKLITLGKSYVEHVDVQYSKLQQKHELRDRYYESHMEKLKDANWRVIEAARTKITLISYLLRIPEYYGFSVYSPFLNQKLISMMINISWSEKKGRKWQVDYFRDNNILIGDMNLICDKGVFLDNYSILKTPLIPLDVKLLGTVIDENYVESINRRILGRGYTDINYYYEYVVLYPIQKLLEIKEFGRKL